MVGLKAAHLAVQEGEGRRSCKDKTAFFSLCGRHLENQVSLLGVVQEIVISASGIQYLVAAMVLLELKIE